MNKDAIQNLLLAWRNRSVSAAAALLKPLFEQADQVLLEYADKAENNRLQAMFLEGRRTLWANREQLESSFHETLTGEIFQFLRHPEKFSEPGAEVMSLVSKDAFELSLALKTISKQAIERDPELYYGLSQRLGVVSGSTAVRYEALPAGPHQLAEVFERSARPLNAERQVLLALYTLFEREVIRKSPPWHEELNEALRGHGILPNLKYELKKDQSPAATAGERPGDRGERSAQRPGHHRAGVPDPIGYQGDTAGTGHEPAANRARTTASGGGPGAGTTPSGHATGGASALAERALPKYQGYGGGRTTETSHQGQLNDAPPGADGQSEEADSGLGDQLLGRIRDLLTSRRQRWSTDSDMAWRPDPANPAPPSELAAIIGSPEVEETIAAPETGVLDVGVRRVVISRALLQKMREVLAARRDYIKTRVGEDRLSHLDEDTIDIVGMLFDAMLEDDRLSNTIKALLSYLHTPYLKLAVRDRAILTQRAHPARRLLENMIEAGSRWVDESDLTFGVYPALQHVVGKVLKLTDFSPGPLREFNEILLAEVKLFCGHQEIREARTIETEKGKARLDAARLRASRAVREQLAGGHSPRIYQGFMQGPWTDYLTLLYLRSNGDTQNAYWRSALDLGERLRTLVDGLREGIRPSTAEVTAMRAELEQRLGAAIPHYEADARQLMSIFSAGHDIEIVAPSPPASAAKAPIPGSATADDEALREHLRNLPPGSWLVFRNENGPDKVAKLSWLNEQTERFLFVDQTGNKAIMVPLDELANQINSLRAHILPATGESYVESTLAQVLKSLETK